MAGRLERRWRGGPFRMLDPPDLPDKPDFPRPPLILGIGIVAGLLFGLGAAFVAESMDPTVRDAADLRNLQGHKTPRLHSQHPAARRDRMRSANPSGTPDSAPSGPPQHPARSPSATRFAEPATPVPILSCWKGATRRRVRSSACSRPVSGLRTRERPEVPCRDQCPSGGRQEHRRRRLRRRPVERAWSKGPPARSRPAPAVPHESVAPAPVRGLCEYLNSSSQNSPVRASSLRVSPLLYPALPQLSALRPSDRAQWMRSFARQRPL